MDKVVGSHAVATCALSSACSLQLSCPLVSRTDWHYQRVPSKTSPSLPHGRMTTCSVRLCLRATLSMQYALRMVWSFQAYWGNVAEVHV